MIVPNIHMETIRTIIISDHINERSLKFEIDLYIQSLSNKLNLLFYCL